MGCNTGNGGLVDFDVVGFRLWAFGIVVCGVWGFVYLVVCCWVWVLWMCAV